MLKAAAAVAYYYGRSPPARAASCAACCYLGGGPAGCIASYLAGLACAHAAPRIRLLIDPMRRAGGSTEHAPAV